MISAIVISGAYTRELASLTQQTLDSLCATTKIPMEVVVVEHGDLSWNHYCRCKTVWQSGEFNYNRFSNVGVTHTCFDYLLVCNNDLIFSQRSVDILHRHAETTGAAALSPVSPRDRRQFKLGLLEAGTQVGRHFAGWCFLLRRDAWERIGGFDEDFPFWCADNSTVVRLARAGLEMMVTNQAIVQHLGSRTLKQHSDDWQKQMTVAQIQKFNQKYEQNLEMPLYVSRRNQMVSLA